MPHNCGPDSQSSGNRLEITTKVVYYTIIIIAVLLALPALGIRPSNLLVAGGVVGIVIGFASQSIVGNLISGIFLMFERPIKIGDQLRVDDISGFVEDIHIVSTIVRTYSGLYVRIPNEKVFTGIITNYVANIARRFEYVVGIRYSDDADLAIEIIEDLIDEQPFALKKPSPQVFVDNLGDNSVNLHSRSRSVSSGLPMNSGSGRSGMLNQALLATVYKRLHKLLVKRGKKDGVSH